LIKFGKKYSKDSRIEFACFSFHVGLLFIDFLSFKVDTENNANFDAVSSKCGNSMPFSKETKFLSEICMNVKVTMLGSL